MGGLAGVRIVDAPLWGRLGRLGIACWALQYGSAMHPYTVSVQNRGAAFEACAPRPYFWFAKQRRRISDAHHCMMEA